MDRVGVHGGVVDFPDLRAVQERGLRDRISPLFGTEIRWPAIGRHYAQLCLPRTHRFGDIAWSRRMAAAQSARKFGSPGEGAEERADDRPGDGVDFHADLVGGQFIEGDLAGIRRGAERRPPRGGPGLPAGRGGRIGRLGQGCY